MTGEPAETEAAVDERPAPDSSADDGDSADRLTADLDRPSSFTVYCPPGYGVMAHFACAMAGVVAEIVETPQADGYFYVASNEPAPIPLLSMLYG